MSAANLQNQNDFKLTAFERFSNTLKAMIEKEASDLHISVGSGFRIRILGELAMILAMPLP